MRILKIIFVLSFIFLNYSQVSFGQNPVKITFIDEASGPADDFFQDLIKTEMTTLLRNRYQVEYQSLYGNDDPEEIKKLLDQAYASRETDIIIGVGSLTSMLLAQRTQFPTPTIASILLDSNLPGFSDNENGSSGISNFAYLESPFDIERDIKKLNEIYAFEKLGIVGTSNLVNSFPSINQTLSEITQEVSSQAEVIVSEETAEETVVRIGEDIDALYVLPLFGFEPEKVKEFYSLINDRKLPSIALLGENYIEAGALMAYEADANIQRMPRRIALNVMKILEGTNAADLPVKMESYNENLIINMATAREIEVFPNFEMMANATVVNINQVPTERTVSLMSVITEGLENNLSLRAAQKEPDIVGKDVNLAIAELLPQATIAGQVNYVDEITALTYQGAQGRLNILGAVSGSQLLFAEPAWANVRVQNILKENAGYELNQTNLDVILDVSEAYLNVLRTESNLQIQQENVAVTRENYEIAQAKEAVGYSGASDLNRWESELALKNINLNDAYASARQAKFRLNQLLNRPIDEPFNVEDVTLEDQMTLIAGRRMRMVEDYGMLEDFADFVVMEAMNNLPELKQIEAAIRVQERLKKSRKRAFYMPSLAVSGNYNQIIQKYQVPEMLPPVDIPSTWNVGLGLQIPIVQGGSRKFALDQTKLQILQLEDQKANLKNQLELGIRSNIETLGASFSRVRLYEDAATAAKKNFAIVQNAYTEGQVNIITLIDAQNNALQTELASINATYTFILDFLTLERSIGFYFFTATQGERDSFFERLTYFINQEDKK